MKDTITRPPHRPPQAVLPAPRRDSSAFELVAVRQGAELEIWLDRLETDEPVAGATIDVETPTGSTTAVEAQNGGYRIPAQWASAAGRYDLIFTVTDKGDADVLTATLVVPDRSPAKTESLAGSKLGTLEGATTLIVAVASLVFGAFSALTLRKRPILWTPLIALFLVIAVGAVRLLAHEGHDHPDEAKGSPAAKGDRSQILPDGSIFMPKPTQRVLAVRTTVSREEEHKRTVELPGRIIPDPNKSGLVQAATAGRLSAPPAGFPKLGTRVEAGDVLAYVTTPFLAIDQPTLRQQAGDLAQQISIVERRVARYETLAKTGAVAQAALDDARLDRRSEHDHFPDRRPGPPLGRGALLRGHARRPYRFRAYCRGSQAFPRLRWGGVCRSQPSIASRFFDQGSGRTSPGAVRERVRGDARCDGGPRCATRKRRSTREWGKHCL
jgi:membrane fusion protein, heavy metal efflux system